MANRPTPGRKALQAELQRIENEIPSRYTRDVLALLKKNGYSVKLAAKLAPLGRDTEDGMREYIKNVRKGLTVDWEVLAALATVAAESAQPCAVLAVA